MVIPLPMMTAPSYGDRTLNAAQPVQRCRNWYPEKTVSGYKLVSAPGLTLVATTGNNAACRGAYVASTGQVFTINGNTIYEVSSIYTLTSRGTISTSSGYVAFADNGTELLIVVNLINAYTLVMSTGGALTLIADANFPSAPNGAAFLDGYFVVGSAGGTGGYNQFYLSQLYDGDTWTPIAYASAEGSSDRLTNIKVSNRKLFLIGEQSVEIWYNTGNASFPFERITGAVIEVGTAARMSAAVSDGFLFMVTSNAAGRFAVVQISDAGVKYISTPYVETDLIGASATALTSWEGFCFRDGGHLFYQLNTNMSFCYDVTEGAWIERDSSDVTPRHRAKVILNASGSSGSPPLVFDYANGKIYQYYGDSDNAANIARVRTFGPIQAGAKRVLHSRIRFVLEVASFLSSSFTLSGTLDWSDDGGLTWSTARTISKAVASSGTTGRMVVIDFNRLGSSRQRYYRITLTGADCHVVLQSAELDAEIGET